MRLRSLEEAFLIKNYLEPSSQKGKNVSKENLMSAEDRSYGIQKIFDLHMKKEYKVETLFIAAGIFDRYIYMKGHANFPRTFVLHLAVISVLMSAKLE